MPPSARGSRSRSSSSGRFRGREQHALNGNTSPSAAGSPPRSVRQRVDLAKDDDLEPALVLPATALGASADGPLAGTLIRPEVDILGIVAATEAHRRHILTMVPDWHNRPVIMQLALGARCVQPAAVGLHASRGALGSRRRLAHTGPQWCTVHLPRVLLADLRRVFSSSGLRRIKAKMMALEGLFRELGAATTRSCVEWCLSGCLAGWRTPRNGCECVHHRHGTPHEMGQTTGQPMGHPGLCRW